MKINNYKDLVEKFKKSKQKIFVISLLFILMIIIWIVFNVLRYEGNNILTMLLIQILFLVVVFYLFIIDFKRIVFSEKIIKRDKDNIINELYRNVSQSNTNKYLYTDSYYIDFENLNIIKFDEIVLFYKKNRTRGLSYKFGTKQYIILILSSGEKLEVINKILKNNYFTFDLIKEKNSKAFVGYTDDNIRKVKEIYKINI